MNSNLAGTIHVCDLAKMYFPNSTQRNAVTQMRRWINMCDPLRERLNELCCKPYQRVLTPKQHQAILEALGRP